ncbi:MAG: hypothetical protein IJ067_10370 [Prevotella sp.]|nr:hypothetical protein [Prevotella sp.]
MSKRLYYSSCSLAAPHIGVVIDDILAGKEAGDDIYWAYCHGALSSCFMNLDGYPCDCQFCHKMYRQYQRVYGAGVHMLPIKKDDVKHKEMAFDFHDADELENFTYRDVKVGRSVLSLYYTTTRDLDMARYEEFHEFAIPLVSELCELVDKAYQIIEEIKPDLIIVHNGRLYENRLFYDIAKALDIKFKAVETVGGHGEPYAKMSYPDALPHNIEKWNQLAITTWEKSQEPEDEKIRIGSSFYERRRNGELVVDVKVYVKDQKKGLLPDGFDPTCRNIAIFTSSQDELVALGDDWSLNRIFPSQSEAIGYILSHTASNIHYYIRIHPNLKGITHKDHLDLYQYDQLPNATVIPPESRVSSYDLMEACEKVVFFGSSTGLEACYWGKPSILIGHCGFESCGAVYHIQKLEDVMPSIEGNLPPKPRMAAIKFAYFLLDRKYKVDKTHIDIDVKIKHHLKWDFTYASYFKLLNSEIIYQLAYFWHCIFLRHFTKPKFHFPWR